MTIARMPAIIARMPTPRCDAAAGTTLGKCPGACSSASSCGVDSSPESLEAVRQSDLLLEPGGRLLLVAVVDHGPRHSLSGRADGDACCASRARGDRRARPSGGGSARAGASRGDPRFERLDTGTGGRPQSCLLDAVASEQATLAVVGTHGLGRTTGVLLGSVATRLLHDARAPCSSRVGHRAATGLLARSSSASTGRRRQTRRFAPAASSSRASAALSGHDGRRPSARARADRGRRRGRPDRRRQPGGHRALGLGQRRPSTSPTTRAARCSSSASRIARPTADRLQARAAAARRAFRRSRASRRPPRPPPPHPSGSRARRSRGETGRRARAGTAAPSRRRARLRRLDADAAPSRVERQRRARTPPRSPWRPSARGSAPDRTRIARGSSRR